MTWEQMRFLRGVSSAYWHLSLIFLFCVCSGVQKDIMILPSLTTEVRLLLSMLLSSKWCIYLYFKWSFQLEIFLWSKVWVENWHFVEKSGKLKLYTTTVLIPLKAGKNFSGGWYLNIAFFLSDEGNFFKNSISVRSVGREDICKGESVSGILCFILVR